MGLFRVKGKPPPTNTRNAKGVTGALLATCLVLSVLSDSLSSNAAVMGAAVTLEVSLLKSPVKRRPPASRIWGRPHAHNDLTRRERGTRLSPPSAVPAAAEGPASTPLICSQLAAFSRVDEPLARSNWRVRRSPPARDPARAQLLNVTNKS
ncbi:hypothetical protein EVAR_22943_1 [Eumeta japonica]|uniref:Uncharacterized protein n=1 Tax=Eumeta variegata TaxID=151549 RepID=A0A4C1UU91_EUMVA|nr:hypothetical protein EVAR_22943_1 [Eumeta japonica]